MSNKGILRITDLTEAEELAALRLGYLAGVRHGQYAFGGQVHQSIQEAANQPPPPTKPFPTPPKRHARPAADSARLSRHRR